MTIRDDFIDAISLIDDDLVVAHIQKKHPTRIQKTSRYLMAAGVYAAAILVVAVILPFVIGRGEEPKPPVDEPITVETNTPAPEDPNLRKIDVTDIDKVYNGVDPEKQSDTVTLDEVKAIISAAQQAYAEYDVIVLADGEELRTLPKKPELTFAGMNDSGMLSTAAKEYREYDLNVFPVIRDAVESRFPERSRGMYLIMDINSTWCPDAETYFAALNGESDWATYVNRSDVIIMEQAFIHHILYQTKDEKLVEIYPSARDSDILNILKYCDIRNGKMLPMTTSYADGLELSVIMNDRSILDTSVSATVVLENTGDSDVTLWQGYLGDYIDEVTVYENGVIRPDKSKRSGDSEAEQTRVLKPGEYIIYHDSIGITNEDDSTAMYSACELEAKAEYISDGDEKKTLTVRITIPRVGVENTIPDPVSITVGLDGNSLSFDRSGEYYYYELLTRRVNNLLSEGDAVLVYRDIQDVDITNLRKGGTYAEFIYGEDLSLYLNGKNTDVFSRIMFMFEYDGALSMVLGADGDYSKTQVYSLTAPDEIMSAIERIIGSETEQTTTTTPAPETAPHTETAVTTPVPVVQVPETTPPAASKQPSVPDSPVDPPETQVSETKTPEIVTTAPENFSLDEEFNEFRENLDAYSETVDNGLRLLVGVNRVVEYGDDSFIIEVVVGNESSQTMRLYDPEGERYPLECLDISFGGESVPVGRSMDLDPICMLPPGKKITFSRHISIQAFEQLTNVDWNAEWTITSNISYLIAGEEYHSRCSMEIPKSGTGTLETITTYLEDMAACSTTYFNGCRYIVGIDKSFYTKGDSITVTVILQNNGPNTLYFKNDYIREHFLDHVEFALGQGYFYEVFNREGSSEDWLEPGEVWVYTTTCDPESYVDMVNWKNDWEITAQVEYTMDGTEYTKRVSVGVPHVNYFY